MQCWGMRIESLIPRKSEEPFSLDIAIMFYGSPSYLALCLEHKAFLPGSTGLMVSATIPCSSIGTITPEPVLSSEPTVSQKCSSMFVREGFNSTRNRWKRSKIPYFIQSRVKLIGVNMYVLLAYWLTRFSKNFTV